MHQSTNLSLGVLSEAELKYFSKQNMGHASCLVWRSTKHYPLPVRASPCFVLCGPQWILPCLLPIVNKGTCSRFAQFPQRLLDLYKVGIPKIQTRPDQGRPSNAVTYVYDAWFYLFGLNFVFWLFHNQKLSFFISKLLIISESCMTWGLRKEINSSKNDKGLQLEKCVGPAGLQHWYWPVGLASWFCRRLVNLIDT